jgi:MSHA biogenesis protein MshP
MNAVQPHLPQRPQSGFAIVSAIFLLVVLAALGAFMLTMSNTQQLTSTQDLQGSRTYWAAKAGIQWAADRIKVTSACPAPTTFTLDGLPVTVTCQPNSYFEGSIGKTIYWVQSTATGGGAVGSMAYTERMLNAFIEF